MNHWDSLRISENNRDWRVLLVVLSRKRCRSRWSAWKHWPQRNNTMKIIEIKDYLVWSQWPRCMGCIWICLAGEIQYCVVRVPLWQCLGSEFVAKIVCFRVPSESIEFPGLEPKSVPVAVSMLFFCLAEPLCEGVEVFVCGRSFKFENCYKPLICVIFPFYGSENDVWDSWGNISGSICNWRSSTRKLY